MSRPGPSELPPTPMSRGGAAARPSVKFGAEAKVPRLDRIEQRADEPSSKRTSPVSARPKSSHSGALQTANSFERDWVRHNA